MTNNQRPVMLLIMDGFGLNPGDDSNAIEAANTPNFDRYWSKYPHTQIGASGLSVGLPDGQMGNSEVGHLNFGAGRVVYQEVTRIDKSILDGDFYENKVLNESIDRAAANGKSVHLMGLLSDGKVHSSMEHLYGLLELCKRKNFDKVYIHAYMDGRDTSPTSGVGFIQQALDKIVEIGVGKIISVIGRYFAMDRDKRWPRNKIAYDLITKGEGERTDDFVKTVNEHYEKDNTDEFLEAITASDAGPGKGYIEDGDSVIFFNFRADRSRQLSRALTDTKFDGFEKSSDILVHLVSLTFYDITLKAEIAYPQIKHKKIFAEILSENGLKQLRIAETEKYPHVTFFFNAGVEKEFEGEDRKMIASPQVATYDLQPEMSASLVTDEVLESIESGVYDVIILNFANCDMVGHTGIFEAAVKAVETVDTCVGKVVEAIRDKGGVVMLTADHGNADRMREPDGKPFTAHTTNPVPFILIDDKYKGTLRGSGVLADVVPTMLQYLDIKQPVEMTGKSLLTNHQQN